MSKKKSQQRSSRQQFAQSESLTHDQINPLKLGFALVWLIGFVILFQWVAPTQNPQFQRWQFWQQLPIQLLDLFDPIPDENAIPAGWSFAPQRFKLLGFATLIWFGSWAFGTLCFRAIRPQLPLTLLEQTLCSLALGLGSFSLITLIGGLAGFLSQIFFLILIGLSCLTTVMIWKKKLLPAQTNNHGESFSKQIGLSLLIAAPFFITMLLGSMLPPLEFDVREYHLQGPKEFFQAGEISFLSHNVYTSFPFLTEMLSLLSMVIVDDWFWGALVGKIVLMGFTPLTALTIYALGKRFFSQQSGIIGALIFFTTPWIFQISVDAYVETGLTFYLSMTLWALFLYWESLTQKLVPTKLVLLTGILAGCAFGCKYPAIISVVIPAGMMILLIPYLQKQTNHVAKATPLIWGGIFVLGFFLTAGPWLLKNLIQTGNPVYPLLYSVFGGLDWNPELEQVWYLAHRPPHFHFSDLIQKVIHLMLKTDWQSPLVFGFAFLSCLVVQEKRRFVYLLGFYAGYYFLTWWLLTHRIDRFWLPMMPVLCLLAGIGAHWTQHVRWIMISRIVIGSCLLFNLALTSPTLYRTWNYLVDLEAMRAQRTLPEFLFIKKSLKAPRVLMLGESAVFEADFPLIYRTVFDQPIFEPWCVYERQKDEQGLMTYAWRSPEEIKTQLEQAGVTHLLINWSEILRYHLTYGYSPFTTPQNIKKLQSQGVLGEEISLTQLNRFKKVTTQELEQLAQKGVSLKSLVKQDATGNLLLQAVQLYPVNK